MKTLILGTKNRDKLREIREILLDVPLRLEPLPEGTPTSPEETGTIEGNAVQKSVNYAEHVGTWCLADDTGLEVDALDGAPGVDAALYAGPDATYADNRDKLLAALEGQAVRTARFRCVMALANPAGEVLATAEGTLEGEITTSAAGEGGFGYDPIFRPLGETKTLAEISADDKNRLSHRGAALRALEPRLLELL